MRKVAKQDLLICGDIAPRRIRIPSRDKGRYIIGDLYYPPGISSSSTPEKKPVLVNWHGSGFVIPGLGSDRVFCARVAQKTGVFVLDADYRKAPEDPFPAAINDVEDTLKWIASQSDQFDASRIAVSGFSAGGNLALVASSSIRLALASIGVQIPIVAAFYPVTDIDMDPETKKVPNPIRPIPAPVASLWNDAYTPNPADRKDPRVSPSFAEASSFPDTVVIITSEGDTLAPEAIALASKLEETSKTVINKSMPGMPHAFDKGCKEGTKEWEQRNIAYNVLISSLQDALKL